MQVVLDTNFPDPTVISTNEGYYAYGTETVGGSHVNLAHSTDLRTWTHLGDAMPVKPAWLQGRRFLWAPDVIAHDGLFYMFYSGQVGEGPEWPVFGLGLATSFGPRGPFIDTGAPLFTGVDFQDIDPMVFQDTDGTHFLFYGSGWHSIRAVQLADSLRERVGEPTDVLWPAPTEYESLVEASFVVFRNGWYFLFYSGDSATTPPHYAVMVARARTLLGPFERLGKPLIVADERFDAPGHCCVIAAPDGQDVMLYHAVDRRRPSTGHGDELRRVLVSTRIRYGDWPEIVKE